MLTIVLIELLYCVYYIFATFNTKKTERVNWRKSFLDFAKQVNTLTLLD